MSTEDNKALVRRSFEELWNQRNMAPIDESISPDGVMWHPTGPYRGSEELKQYANMYLSAFPDVHFTIEDMVAEGDKVVLRWSGRGTHQGALQGIAPTGKPVSYTHLTLPTIYSV